MKLQNKILTLFSSLLVILLLIGCGSDSQRNDQGVTFNFFGWFQDIAGGTGLTGLTIPITEANPEAERDTGAIFGFAGLRNNLESQAITVQRINHSYYIPGATVQPQDESVSATRVLGPNTVNNDGLFNENSTLPPSFEENIQTYFAGVPIITPDIREFIGLNRNSMPQPPFLMIVSSYATGVTTSGSRIDSNTIEIDVTITPDVIITPPGIGGVDAGGVTEGGATTEENGLGSGVVTDGEGNNSEESGTADEDADSTSQEGDEGDSTAEEGTTESEEEGNITVVASEEG